MGRGFAARRLLTAGVLMAVTVGAGAGCTSGSTSTAPPAGHPTTSGGPTSAAGAAPHSTTGGGPTSAAGAAPPSLSERGLASPGCSSATATAAPLHGVGAATVTTGGSPFGVVAAPDGRWAFAVTEGGSGSAASSVEVLRLSTGTGPAGAPGVTKVRSVPLTTAPGAAALPAGAAQAAGAAITPDGKYLVVAGGSGVVVLSVARAEAGTAGAVVGSLAAPSRAGGPGGAGGGAIEVAVSPDSRLVIVTLEDDAEAAVFDLAAALAHGFGAADYVGAIPLGLAPVGMAVSPDGRWLYATSEGTAAGQHPVGLGGSGSNSSGSNGSGSNGSGSNGSGSNGCGASVPGTAPHEAPGTLTVIDLRRAETDPAHAVTAVVQAGHQPVRVVTAAEGTQVWVTARASDAVLCFSAARLASDPEQALVAVVRVGSEPVGLAPVRGGALIAVADSNRFAAAGQSSSLSFISVTAALAGRPAVVGGLPTGGFPRDMAVSPGGTLLVSDYASGQVQAVATAGLP